MSLDTAPIQAGGNYHAPAELAPTLECGCNASLDEPGSPNHQLVLEVRPARKGGIFKGWCWHGHGWQPIKDRVYDVTVERVEVITFRVRATDIDQADDHALCGDEVGSYLADQPVTKTATLAQRDKVRPA